MKETKIQGYQDFWYLRMEIEGKLGDFDSKGNIKVFNPAGYVFQLIEANEVGREMSFLGLRDDLEAVVAETLIETEFREIKYEVSFDGQGKLIWLASGHEGRGAGTVLDMAEATVTRYEKMARNLNLNETKRVRAEAMQERFGWEREQLRKVIDALEKGGEGQAVLGILPDNEVVYSVSEVRYLTVYRLEGNQIVAFPFMNRYSNRMLSLVAGKEDLSEEELILSVIDLGKNVDAKKVFKEIDKLVSLKEREEGKIGEVIDRTSDVAECDQVIESAAEFLEEIIRFEVDRLKEGSSWREVKGRLNTGWELVIKNIIGFISGENYLNREELLEKVDLYVGEINKGFSREGLFIKIIEQHDLQILTQKVAIGGGACGSLNLPGMGNSLNGSLISNLGKKEMIKNCGQCGVSINAEISAGYVCPSCGGVYEGC